MATEVEGWLLYRGEWRFVGLGRGLLREWGLLCAPAWETELCQQKGEPGLEQAELKEIESELEGILIIMSLLYPPHSTRGKNHTLPPPTPPHHTAERKSLAQGLTA